MLIHQMVVIPMVESTRKLPAYSLQSKENSMALQIRRGFPVKVLFFHRQTCTATPSKEKKYIGFTACNVYREIGGKNLGMEGP